MAENHDRVLPVGNSTFTRPAKGTRSLPARRVRPLGKDASGQRDIGLAGGFGVTFWLIVQDLSQLRSTYGDTWPTFLANADVLQAFGTNDWDTAEYLSKMTGEATIFVRTQNQSRGLSRGKQSQRQEGDCTVGIGKKPTATPAGRGPQAWARHRASFRQGRFAALDPEDELSRRRRVHWAERSQSALPARPAPQIAV